MKLVLYSISLKILINIPGPTSSGRYVIVQMDNPVGFILNLREVMAFGEKGETSVRSLLEIMGDNGVTSHHHHHRQRYQLQTAPARVLDELGPKRKHF